MRPSSRVAPAGDLPALDHEALLTLARKISAAASDCDLEHLARATAEFSDALYAHLRSETAALTGLSPSEERVLNRGRSRVWSAAKELLWDGTHGCPHPSSYCASRAEELLALLTLQAHDEGRAFQAHTHPGRRRGR